MTRPVLACLAAVILLAGCADAPEADDPEPAARPPTPRAVEEPTDAPEADDDDVAVPAQLDFALPELSGGQVVGAELAGNHLALWFWTPW